MALSTHFQYAIDLVDPAKSLTSIVDPTFSAQEYEVNGLTITGGSDAACDIGAATLLDEMGFRFYTPQPAYWKLPSTVRTNIAISRRRNWIEATSAFLVYGHSWAGTNVASRDQLNDAYARWATLAGCGSNLFPAGHRWKNIIENSTSFFTANPQLLRLQGGGQETFALGQIIGTPDWDMLAEFCAAFLLDAGLDDLHRTYFDPVDGDDNISDHVYPFSLDVVTRMRSGTGAVGDFTAQAGVPDAEIGVYAYAGHRLPPSAPYAPVYTQIALAFNRTDLTYQDLFEGHGALAQGVAIREYWDTEVWSHGRPMVNRRAKSNYFDSYDPLVAAGAKAVRSEFTAAWLVNMVQARVAILKCRTGSAVWGDVVQEIVDDVFGGDQAVADLYAMWGDPGETFNKWSLRKSFEIVDRMVDGPYKTHFQQLLTLHYQYLRCDNADFYGIVRNPGGGDDTFAFEISKLLGWATALRDDDILHSYALMRQEANTALNDYPDLKFNAAPEPAWFTTNSKPTNADWLAALSAISAETQRDATLEDDDLVLMAVTPVAAGDTGECTVLRSEEGVATYKVLGPSVVTLTDLEQGTQTTLTYGAGLHDLVPQSATEVTWAGGMVFMNVFPEARKDPDSQGRRTWLFVPAVSSGQVNLQPSTRWSFFDADPTRKDWTPGTTFPALGPGQVAVDNTNTRGAFVSANAGRHLSPRAGLALVSRSLARAEGSTSTVRFVGS